MLKRSLAPLAFAVMVTFVTPTPSTFTPPLAKSSHRGRAQIVVSLPGVFPIWVALQGKVNARDDWCIPMPSCAVRLVNACMATARSWPQGTLCFA